MVAAKSRRQSIPPVSLNSRPVARSVLLIFSLLKNAGVESVDVPLLGSSSGIYGQLEAILIQL